MKYLIILLLSLPFTGKAQINTTELVYRMYNTGALIISVDTLPKGSGSDTMFRFSESDTTARFISGSTSLTATYIGYGDGSGLLTGSNNFTYDEVNETFTILNQLLIDNTNDVYKIGKYNGNDNGNNVVIDDNTNLAYYDNTAHTGFFGINTSTPTVALDVVGDVNVANNFNFQGAGNSMFSSGATTIEIRGSSSDDVINYNSGTKHDFQTGTVTMAVYGAGAATFDASGNITSVSDERLKTNIKPYKTGLKELLLIKPIQYKWNEKSKMETAGTYAGFSAQNVKANIPLGTGENKDGYLSLQDRALLATAYNAIQELAAKVYKLEKQNAELVKKLPSF